MSGALTHWRRYGGAPGIVALATSAAGFAPQFVASLVQQYGELEAAKRLYSKVERAVELVGKRTREYFSGMGAGPAPRAAEEFVGSAPAATPAPQTQSGGYHAVPVGQRSEKKFFDTLHAAAVVPLAGVVLPSLNLVPQDTSESGRIGRRIKITNVDMIGQIHLAQGAAILTDNIRVFIVLDTQANKAAPALGDYLDGTPQYKSFRNLVNRGRFRTLHTFRMDVMPTYGGPANGGEFNRTWEWHKSFSPQDQIVVEFNSTLGAQSEITSNNIVVMAITSSGIVAAANGAQLSYNARIRFHD